MSLMVVLCELILPCKDGNSSSLILSFELIFDRVLNAVCRRILSSNNFHRSANHSVLFVIHQQVRSMYPFNGHYMPLYDGMPREIEFVATYRDCSKAVNEQVDGRCRENELRRH
jgi:hypothetical protein